LQSAKDHKNEAAECRILLILQGEKDRAFWRRLNWALGQPRGSSVRSIQVENADRSVTEFSTQPEIQSMIWEKYTANDITWQKKHQSAKVG